MSIKLQVEVKRSQYEHGCIDCGGDIPENKVHFRILDCKCRYHAHCLVLTLLREGLCERGTFQCTNCLQEDERYEYLDEPSDDDDYYK